MANELKSDEQMFALARARIIEWLRTKPSWGNIDDHQLAAASLLESQAQRIATLEAENERWKQVFADVDIDRQAIAAERDQLREALQRAIKLLIKWHDGANDKVAVRFDLTDHPQVKPLYAALAQEQPEKL